MNLFRSEEHARNWPGFKAELEKNLLPLEAYAKRFGGERFRARRSPRYMTFRATGDFKAV